MKKFLAILLSSVMVLSLAACGSSAQAPAATEAATEAATTAAAQNEPATVTVWRYPGNEGTTEVYDALAAKVHELYPWITVQYEELSWDAGPEKFTIACATNTTPDIYIDGYSRIAPAVQAGLTMDITDVINANRGNLMYDSQVDGMVGDKIHFFLVYDGLPYGILVNMTMAKELGVADMFPADKLTWSYDDYLKICRAAKAANPDIYAQDLYAGSRSSDAWYYTWILGAGGKITDGATKSLFNDPQYKEASLKVLNLYKTLLDEKLAPAEAITQIDLEAEANWDAGLYMMCHCGYNNASDTYRKINEGTIKEIEYDIYAVPTPDGKEPGLSASWGSSGMCAFGGKGHDEATKLFIDTYIKYPEYVQQIASIAGTASVFIKGVELEYPNETVSTIINRGKAYGSTNNRSDFGILQPWWTDFRETFYPQLQDFYAGKIDAQAVLDNWQAAADKVISDYNAANK